MHCELTAAVDFVQSQLGATLGSLYGILQERYASHWYPESPLRGSAYRCLTFGTRCRIYVDSDRQTTLVETILDPVVAHAALADGSVLASLEAKLGSTAAEEHSTPLTLWIDPGCVCYQRGGEDMVVLMGELTSSASPVREDLFGPVRLDSVAAKGDNFYASLGAFGQAMDHGMSNLSLLQATQSLDQTGSALASTSAPHPPPTPTHRPPPLSLVSMASYTSPTPKSRAVPIVRPEESFNFTPKPAFVLESSALVHSPTPRRTLTSSSEDIVARPASAVSAVSSGSSYQSDMDAFGPRLSPEMYDETAAVFKGPACDDAVRHTAREPVYMDRAQFNGFKMPTRPTMDARRVSDPKSAPCGGEFKIPPLPASAHHNASMSFSFGPSTEPNTPRRRRHRHSRSRSTASSRSETPRPIDVDALLTDDERKAKEEEKEKRRKEALAGRLVEHSGGKVGVLGGGVLLGMPKSSASAPKGNSQPPRPNSTTNRPRTHYTQQKRQHFHTHTQSMGGYVHYAPPPMPPVHMGMKPITSPGGYAMLG